MKLFENFYKIINQDISDEKAEFRVALNAENFIYKSHFPNNPITPGVFLFQIIVELFGVVQGKNFEIKMLKSIKFTAPLSPVEFPEVDFLLSFTKNENFWQVKAIVKENETVFAKISLTLCHECTNKTQIFNS
ncbi:MAG: hypothetical protein LBN95_05585 [Prevotellaceae bacterium]|jgi:3-hydroxyacyl-[acyl-carrier-protein] dehydratase|nr:hypothetical protein [Prevotellaceae bacterium]